MSYKEHALREFKAVGWCDKNGKFKDSMQKLLCKQVLQLLNLFSKHGHSGSTAPYAIALFKTLANFEPIGGLTGEDSEWTKVGPDLWQNNRCYHVFKGSDGKAYDTEGKIFKDKDGCCWTNKDSRVYIKFPYTPKREYIDSGE